MGTPVNERVKKWRERQRDKGKRIMNVPLDENSIARLNRMRDILNLSKDLSTYKPVTKGQIIESALIDYEKKVVNETFREYIMGMSAIMIEDGHKASDIANYLNIKKYPTLTGKGKWHGSTIQKMLKEKQ